MTQNLHHSHCLRCHFLITFMHNFQTKRRILAFYIPNKFLGTTSPNTQTTFTRNLQTVGLILVFNIPNVFSAIAVVCL